LTEITQPVKQERRGTTMGANRCLDSNN